MRMYLYLGRRDKKGVQIVTVLDGPKVSPTRLADLSVLNLPVQMAESVGQIIHDNRMYWEPWIESANSYMELRQALLKRGYRDLAISSRPIYEGTSLYSPPVADTSKVPPKKTMVAKKD